MCTLVCIHLYLYGYPDLRLALGTWKLSKYMWPRGDIILGEFMVRSPWIVPVIYNFPRIYTYFQDIIIGNIRYFGSDFSTNIRRMCDHSHSIFGALWYLINEIKWLKNKVEENLIFAHIYFSIYVFNKNILRKKIYFSETTWNF